MPIVASALPAGAAPRRAPNPPGTLRTLRHQLPYDLLTQWRTPAAVLFTLLLPIGFLVLFAASADVPGTRAAYVPTSMIIGVLSGSLTNLAITLTYLREYGMLKQARLQPMPPAALLLSRVLAAGVLSVLAAAVVVGVGVGAYGFTPDRPALLVASVLLGTAVGSGLGLLVSAAIRSEVAATPIANAVTLLLLVLAGAFVPLSDLPDGVRSIAELLPGFGVTELARAGGDAAVELGATAWLNAVGWTVAALAAGLAAFRWRPTRRR